MTTEVLGRPSASSCSGGSQRQEITTPWSQLQAQRAVGGQWREACRSQKPPPAAGLLSTGLGSITGCSRPQCPARVQSYKTCGKLSTEGAGGKARGSLATPGHQFWSRPNQAPRRAAEAHFILLVQGDGPLFRALYKYSPQHLRQKKRAVASLIHFQKFSFPYSSRLKFTMTYMLLQTF